MSYDELRDALLARVMWDRASLEPQLAAGDVSADPELAGLEPPTDEELWGLIDDPGADLSDADEWWPEESAAASSPAEPDVIKAGFWDRGAGDGCGFASGGVCDTLRPGPVLAGLAARAWDDGPARLSDDELIGVLRAARRLTSWAAVMELSAVADLVRRREREAAATGDDRDADHVPDEVAAALTLTARAADHLVTLALQLDGLPQTRTAMWAGAIDRQKAAVIADETCSLTREHRAAVERQVLPRAEDQTTGQLRGAVRRAVIAADPAAARRRKQAALRRARVERWSEDAGTSALAGRDLPPADALAADSHLSGLARRLKDAGVTGTMDQLRARLFLALLAGQPPDSLLSATAHPAATGDAEDASHPAGAGQAGDVSTRQATGRPGAPALTDGSQASAAGEGAVAAGVITLTMPLATWLGLSQVPGEVAGYGPLDATDSRRLAAILGRNPDTRWQLTLTDHNGHPVAHGTTAIPPPGTFSPPSSRGSPPSDDSTPSSAAGRSADDLDNSARDGGTGCRVPECEQIGGRTPGTGGARRAQAGGGRRAGTRVGARAPGPAPNLWGWLSGVGLVWLETAPCAHRRESAAYRPPLSMQRLIRVRHQTCTFPGCRRPAVRCDQEHTVPFHRGGRTCECNLGPVCRRHHGAKQAPGWRLEQPRPGHMVWRSPSGRTYTTTPTTYAI
ncbi:MAG TPA: HNH endonuclease signature motif containing protein [Streptosporangiaceae bacterium]|jgi:hypothetical protein